MKKIIDAKLVEMILNYLSKQQWGEANDMIVQLSQLENLEETKKEAKK